MRTLPLPAAANTIRQCHDYFIYIELLLYELPMDISDYDTIINYTPIYDITYLIF